jgi:hypothetical protein
MGALYRGHLIDWPAMANPYRGEIPADPAAGHPRGAAEIRRRRGRLAQLALAEALEADPTFGTRYEEGRLRLFLRDYDGHLEVLARALAAGDDELIGRYSEWLVPLMRRRGVPMADLATLVRAMLPAVRSVLTPHEAEAAQATVERWAGTLRRARRLAGDRKRNPVFSFLWKGVGIAD